MAKTSKAQIIKQGVDGVSNILKRNAWSAILESLATIILGILLIAWQDAVVQVIGYVAGTILIIKGAYQIINYFVVKGQNNIFNNDLLGGVTSLLIGIAFFCLGEEIINVFRIIIGIWMIYEALVRINTSIKLHAVGIKAWSYVLILALMMLILGIFVTFYQGAVVALVGWTMVLTGAIGIVGDTMFIQYVNKIAESLTGKNATTAGKTKKEK
jgi:uncharacterized membrane protein HdeD (DUF308 family)